MQPDCEYTIQRVDQVGSEYAADGSPILREDERLNVEAISARHYIQQHGGLDLIARIREYCLGHRDIAQAHGVLELIERAGYGYGPGDRRTAEPATLVSADRRDGVALANLVKAALEASPRHGACTGGSILVHSDFCPEHVVMPDSPIMLDWGLEVSASPARTSMAAAVSADLARMPALPGGVDASMRALASYLSEAIDQHGGTGNPATTARLAQELRTVLTELARRERADDDSAEEFARSLAEPTKGDEDA